MSASDVWRGALLVILTFGCSEPLTREECDTLLDRYVGLLANSDRPSTSDADVVRLKAQAREKAAREPSFRRCSREVSRTQFQCAMKADSVDRLEQCLL